MEIFPTPSNEEQQQEVERAQVEGKGGVYINIKKSTGSTLFGAEEVDTIIPEGPSPL